MKIFNTLTKCKDEFIPLDKVGKVVKMYTCGMTVYSFTHIGHLRTYLTSDILRRYLIFCGYDVKQVMNVTDVGHLQSDADEGEDKLEVKAQQEKTTPWLIAREYEKEFFKNLNEFGVMKPSVIARASEHVNDMIEFIKGLEIKGYTYKTDVGIIYDTSKFEKYTDFAKINLEGQKAGARVTVDSQRKNAWDFALWVTNKPNHIMKWDSPWGIGYPGWHIECSAMCSKYLGEQLDIHTGGIDHIQIHHTNEIAQTEGYTGNKMCNYWVHTNFLNINNEKMSKSIGNLYTLDDLRTNGFSPLALRYMFMKSDYKKTLDFTWSTLLNSQNELIKIWNCFEECPDPSSGKILEQYIKKFKNAMDDSQNMPVAISVLWELINSTEKKQDIVKTGLILDKVFGLELENASYQLSNLELLQGVNSEIKQSAGLKLAERNRLRKEKRYEDADAIREEIESLGFEIKDSREGSRLVLSSYGKIPE